MVEYGALPPEINSARAYAGPQSAPLIAAHGAWEALSVNLASNAAALNSAIMSLLAGGWQGPSSAMMAAGGAQNVAWLYQAATQAQTTALAAAQAASAVEATYAGVVPPPLIEANRNLLEALVASNFLGVNSGAIAACVAEYDEMWTRDATVMYGFSADAAAATGMLIPFIPLQPTVNPGGFASQAAAVAQAGGTAAGQAGQNSATAGQSVSSMGAGDSASIMSMAPQFLSAVPQALQGLAQPLMGGMGNPMQSLGGFQSLLAPFLSSMSNPAMGGVGGAGAATSAAASFSNAGGAAGGFGAGGAGPMAAGLGKGGSLGGLSVPATWAASAQPGGSSAAPVSATGGASSAAAPATAGGGVGGAGAAPMAAMGGRENSGGNDPSYGAPVRVLPRPR